MGLLRDWGLLKFTFHEISGAINLCKTIKNWSSTSIGQNYSRRHSRNRARSCLLRSRPDWPSVSEDVDNHVSYETVKTRVTTFKMFGQKCVFQEGELAIGNVNTSYILYVTSGAATVLSYPTLFNLFFHPLELSWLLTRTKGNIV